MELCDAIVLREPPVGDSGNSLRIDTKRQIRFEAMLGVTQDCLFVNVT